MATASASVVQRVDVLGVALLHQDRRPGREVVNEVHLGLPGFSVRPCRDDHVEPLGLEGCGLPIEGVFTKVTLTPSLAPMAWARS